ncbi:MAG: DUF3450 domain-containing protein, partial [Methylococcaceae bacterium]|nr:DUF3450 domain-containing protein [Methylococcaceae bacterium]
MSQRLKLIGAVLLLCTTSSNIHAGSVDNLADELVRLRGEVEELQSQLDLAKEDHRNRMQALSSQHADLGVEDRRQSVNLEKMQQTLLKFEQSKESMTANTDNLPPVIIGIISQLYNYVQDSIPFKKEERLSVLTKLRSDIDSQLIDPKRAANRLWAFVEDEIRLSKENGIYRQTIELNGEKMLADIAKLGTVLLYFQTNDRQVGMAKKMPAGNWQFVAVEDTQSKEQIAILFDSLKKQIRQGYFVLPNPLGS